MIVADSRPIQNGLTVTSIHWQGLRVDYQGKGTARRGTPGCVARFYRCFSLKRSKGCGWVVMDRVLSGYPAYLGQKATTTFRFYLGLLH